MVPREKGPEEEAQAIIESSDESIGSLLENTELPEIEDDEEVEPMDTVEAFGGEAESEDVGSDFDSGDDSSVD